MNKKSFFLIGAIVILAIIIALNYSGNMSKSTSQYDTTDRKFSVPVEDIFAINLSYRNGTSFHLKREQFNWTVNDSFKVHDNIIGNLLEVLSGLELKYIPPNAALENMITGLNTVGIRVEIFDKAQKKIRSYHVGGTTSGELGTVFLMDGYQQPYVMELPYFEGSLRGRFLFSDIDQFRDRNVFNANVEDIKSVALEYPKDQLSSFRVEKNSNGAFEVSAFYPNGFKYDGKLKDGAIERFLRGFDQLDAEAYENKHILRDSIHNLIPLARISLELENGFEKKVDLYPLLDIFNPTINTLETGSDLRVERYFADCSNGDFMLVQDLLFRRILWKYEEFYE